MSQEPSDSLPTPPETDLVADYPRMSRLAISSLLLAIVGVGAVFSPLLVCAAVAGAAVAVAALGSIARADSPLLGRRAAVIALLVSLLSAAWGLTARTARQQRLSREAQQLAEKWLQLVRAGRQYEAHQLHLPWKDRQAPGTNLADYYKNTREPRFDFESFFRAQPLPQLIAAGNQGQVRFLQSDSLTDESYAGAKTDVVTLRYALDYQQDGQPRSLTFLVILARILEPQQTEAHWELRGVQLPKDRR